MFVWIKVKRYEGLKKSILLKFRKITQESMGEWVGVLSYRLYS